MPSFLTFSAAGTPCTGTCATLKCALSWLWLTVPFGATQGLRSLNTGSLPVGPLVPRNLAALLVACFGEELALSLEEKRLMALACASAALWEASNALTRLETTDAFEVCLSVLATLALATSTGGTCFLLSGTTTPPSPIFRKRSRRRRKSSRPPSQDMDTRSFLDWSVTVITCSLSLYLHLNSVVRKPSFWTLKPGVRTARNGCISDATLMCENEV
mmetsp:Transcript_1162/g.3599  ORF Transcript_1162/g.3599 Transcript_1162/m.3599 type:complete len:216 (+) Transcript_1162:2322-2969(+)